MEAAKQYLAFDVGRTHYATSIEYVGYIVAASQEFPHCMPPRMPAYVERVMRMEQKLVPIINLARFESEKELTDEAHIYSLVVVFAYQEKSVGILTDRVSILSVQEGGKEEMDSVTQRMVLNFNGKNFVLLNVPGFYEEINEGRT